MSRPDAPCGRYRGWPRSVRKFSALWAMDCIFQGSSWLLSICKMGQQKPPHRKTDYRFQGGVDDAAEASAGAAVAAPLVLAPE